MRKSLIDLTGQRFGRWTVLRLGAVKRYASGKGTVPFWLCRCDCGTEKEVSGCSLRNGNSVSCRCYQREFQRERNTKHGHTTHGGKATSEYTAWAHMIQRCTNPYHPSFADYGGRGITVCDEWLEAERFLRDMGPKPSPKHSLERKNNNRGYSSDNCKWATSQEQARNQRGNRLITWNGQTKLLTDWAKELGCRSNSLSTRLHRGWTIQRAMTTPFKNQPTPC